MFNISLGSSSLNLTDEKLLEQTKKWNARAFEEIYERRNQKIFSYLMTILNYNKEESNQILWDVFIALYEYNKENKIQNCKSFLYMTAHNRALDLIKKKSEIYDQESLQDSVIDYKDQETKDKIESDFKEKFMQKYLNMLGGDERQVIHLYYYEEKSYEEIATIIWSNKNTVWRNIMQAKKKLKSFLQNEDDMQLFI